MPQKKLFLLDAFALIYRSYFAFIKNPRINSQGQNTSAIFGFVNTLLDVINKHKPTHIAVAFDMREPTLRHIEFPEYKANRDAMPEDIQESIPYIQELLKGFNIPQLGVNGYEADDVIGTLAKRAKKEGFETYMMTPDKDYAQLVEDGIYMYRPGRFGKPAETLGVEEVKQKFDIEHPLQVIDLLGMMGDASDNIPGIPGVGEKTAVKFLKKYGSMEGLYENLDDLKGAMKNKVADNKELAFLSKKLVTIELNVPLECNLDDFILEEANKEILEPLLATLEFKTLGKKIFGGGNDSPVAENKSADSETPDLFQNDLFTGEDVDSVYNTYDEKTKHYRLVESEKDWSDLLNELTNATTFCFDTETDGLDTLNGKVLGLALSTKKDTGWYIPTLSDAQRKDLEKLNSIWSDDKTLKIAHNIKFDLAMLRNAGIKPVGPFYDTMLAHYLLKPDERHNMDSLCENYLNYRPISIETLIGKGRNAVTMDKAPLDKVAIYAAEDADCTFQLYELFDPMLSEDEKSLLANIEMPVMEVLLQMETEGINLDTKMLNDFSDRLETTQEELEEAIYEAAERPFTISSPKQLGLILFDHLKLDPKAKKTKTGQYATGEEVLTKLKDKHPIIGKILEYREVTKLKSTYVDALPKLVDANTGRIHTSYHQAVASTGRLSSKNPNLQNIPIKTELGQGVRKAFVPRDENHVLLAADYSQVELRIVAALAKDENMVADFTSKKDIHSATAARVFGVDECEVDRATRAKAKAVNFGIIYGQGAFTLGQQLGIPRSEAKEIIDSYLEKYASVKSLMDQQVNDARDNGYVVTIMGRKRHLPDINSRNATVRSFAERNAINAPIQGSAADIIKKAMIDIQQWLNTSNLKTKMLLQVHDELVFDVPKDEVDIVSPIIKEKMEQAYPIEVPMEVEIGLGNNWLEAH
jgi:DNA polymerase-1